MSARGAGGTSGGVGQFFLGLALLGGGVYLFLDRVMVASNIASMWYGHGGLIILPFGLGLALVFLSGKSILGWTLTAGSVAAVIVSVLANLTIFFAPTGLLRTVGMIALIFVGLLMVVRSLRPR
jgi:hypothetical protein